MSEPLDHRWGAIFVAACGATGCRIAPSESLVTCPACKALPDSPAAWAERDQFAAAMREAGAER